MGGAPYPDQEDSLGLSRGGRRTGRAYWTDRAAGAEGWGEEQGLQTVHKMGVMMSESGGQQGLLQPIVFSLVFFLK